MNQAAEKIELVSMLRQRGITSQVVLEALEQVPRDLFVEGAFVLDAYADMALPIACGQTISQPFIVAYMTEHLGPDENADVLEIGTGSGYQAAILAHLFHHVYTIERHRLLLEQAKARFDRLGLANITAIVGDGWEGWPEERCFARIIITAAACELPERLLAQLAEGGRMILPLGENLEVQRLVQVDRIEGALRQTDLLPVQFVEMVKGAAD